MTRTEGNVSRAMAAYRYPLLSTVIYALRVLPEPTTVEEWVTLAEHEMKHRAEELKDD